MRVLVSLSLWVLLCGGGLAPAFAEKADRDKPLNFVADSARVDDARHLNILTGNVEMTKGTMVFRAARVEVRQNPDGTQTAHAVGGRYLYAPGSLDGTPLQASGYRMGGHTVEVLEASHPLLEGVNAAFDVDDEIYLCPVFEHDVVPLLGTTADLAPEGFRDTYAEVRFGDSAAMCVPGSWGSRIVGWAKPAGRSPLVYLQPGHGPSTMQHPDYRRLLANALRWVASADAHQWAAANPQPF